MSFLAKMELEGANYNILHCYYSFRQDLDTSRQPQGEPKGGDLYLEIESNGSGVFIDWMLNTDKCKDGKITFFRRDAMSKMQEIKFEKAFCLDLYEEFNANNLEPMKVKLRLSPKRIDFGNIDFTNH